MIVNQINFLVQRTYLRINNKIFTRHDISESIRVEGFGRFFGSFEPIFPYFSEVNINIRILTPEKEAKKGQKNPEKSTKSKSVNSLSDSADQLFSGDSCTGWFAG
jgi:hypothetical protein